METPAPTFEPRPTLIALAVRMAVRYMRIYGVPR